MRNLFNCGKNCARRAGYLYILSVLLALGAFNDSLPDMARGICFLAAGTTLVLALLYFRESRRHQPK